MPVHRQPAVVLRLPDATRNCFHPSSCPIHVACRFAATRLFCRGTRSAAENLCRRVGGPDGTFRPDLCLAASLGGTGQGTTIAGSRLPVLHKDELDLSASDASVRAYASNDALCQVFPPRLAEGTRRGSGLPLRRPTSRQPTSNLSKNTYRTLLPQKPKWQPEREASPISPCSQTGWSGIGLFRFSRHATARSGGLSDGRKWPLNEPLTWKAEETR